MTVMPLAAVFAMSCFQISDPDLGFHLATGRAVMQLGEIPATNVLTFTQPEHPWKLSQWIPGVIFEWVRLRAGVTGIIVTKAATVTLLWAFVLASCRRLGASPVAAATATIVCAVGASFRFVSRPLIFSHLGLAVVIYMGTRYLNSGSSSERRRWGAAIAVAMAAACHVHAGAVYLFLAAFALGVGIILDPLWLRSERASVPASAGAEVLGWITLAASLGAATLALYHPYGIEVLKTPFQMGADSHLAAHLIEFRRPWQFPFSYLWSYWLVVLLSGAALATNRRRSSLFGVFTLLGFAVLSFRFVRLAFAFSIAAAPVISVAFDSWGKRLPVENRRAVGLLSVAALAFVSPNENWRRFPTGFGYNPHFFPVELFDKVEELGIDGRLYTSDRWASPLIGFQWPERRSFFDPRLDAFSPEFVTDEYMHVRYGNEGWEAILAQYEVEGVLLAYTSPGEARFQEGAPNVRQHLAASDAWSLVWFDDRGELFVRSNGPTAAVAQTHGIENFDPDRMDYLARPASLAGPLTRALSDGPESARMIAATTIALADAGEGELALQVLTRGLTRWPDEPYLMRAAQMLAGR